MPIFPTKEKVVTWRDTSVDTDAILESMPDIEEQNGLAFPNPHKAAARGITVTGIEMEHTEDGTFSVLVAITFFPNMRPEDIIHCLYSLDSDSSPTFSYFRAPSDDAYLPENRIPIYHSFLEGGDGILGFDVSQGIYNPHTVVVENGRSIRPFEVVRRPAALYHLDQYFHAICEHMNLWG